MTALACDIGATRIKLGLIQQGKVEAQSLIDSRSEMGLAKRLPEIAGTLRSLCERRGVDIQDCSGVSLSVPSLVDPVSGRILAEYGRFRDMPLLDLRQWAKSELGLPAAIENDARMATIGEWKHGAGRGSNNLVMLTLGTGLGTSAVMDGKILRGKHGQAGCLGGHFTLRYGGTACGCGNTGCAEAEASTAFLGDLAKKHPDYSRSLISAEPILDYAAIFAKATEGDTCARAIRDHSLLVWSSLAVSLIHAYDPELVILGGGIMKNSGLILPAVREYVRKHAHTPWGNVTVVASALGDAAALVAGEWLLQEQAQYFGSDELISEGNARC
ncbi:MAG TPA: ROK family protein [Verrucomicrobiae bacterium]|jgi:glucokinase